MEPLEPEARPTAPRCGDCGTALSGEYCTACGQRDEPLRQPLRHFVAEAAAEYLGVDGRLWRTLRVLFVSPGGLTREYLAGRRTRYLGPHRIYLAASVFFFFVLTILDPVGQVQRATEGFSPDSTTTVAERLEDLIARERALRAAPSPGTDSLAVLLSAPTDTSGGDSKALRIVGPAAVQQAYGDSAFAEYGRDLELRRLAWQRTVLDTLDRTRTIRPRDYDDAAALLFPDTTRLFLVGDFGIEAEGSSARDLQRARTPGERNQALGALARRAVSHLPLVMFLLLPVFAALLKLLYVRSRWYYVEHLIFALHVHAHAFVVLGVVALLAGYFSDVDWAAWLSMVLFAWPPVYFAVAMRRVYDRPWGRTLTKAWLLGVIYPVALLAGVALSVWLAAEFG